MFSLAIQAGKLLHRPHIPMLAENNVRQGFFERPAFESMRAKLPADLQPVATFAYLTGWRIQSEVLPLRWGQVDRTAGIVRLEPRTTKNGDGRVFDFSGLPDLCDLFADLWTAHEMLATATHTICPWREQGTDTRRACYSRDAGGTCSWLLLQCGMAAPRGRGKVSA